MNPKTREGKYTLPGTTREPPAIFSMINGGPGSMMNSASAGKPAELPLSLLYAIRILNAIKVNCTNKKSGRKVGDCCDGSGAGSIVR